MLAGWAKYRTVTISHANVDADLLNYPVYLNLSAAGGIGDVDLTSIFTELGTNSLKLAVATDTDVECYVEIVSWDAVTPYAELWVCVPTVSGASDTVLYIYYDNSHTDNSTYVGVTGSVPGKQVWDANYVLVMHMNDTTTSAITGSTALNAAGVKKGANEPVEAAGGIGKTQDFDGSNDYVRINDSASLSVLGPLTLEVYFNADTQPAGGDEGILIGKSNNLGADEWLLRLRDTGRILSSLYSANIGNNLYSIGTVDVADTNYHYAATTWDGTNATGHLPIYIDGVSDTLTADAKTGTGYAPSDKSTPVDIGMGWNTATYCFDGKISETRISKIKRSDAHIHANNPNFRDNLVTFGAETLNVIAQAVGAGAVAVAGTLVARIRRGILVITSSFSTGLIVESSFSTGLVVTSSFSSGLIVTSSFGSRD